MLSLGSTLNRQVSRARTQSTYDYYYVMKILVLSDGRLPIFGTILNVKSQKFMFQREEMIMYVWYCYSCDENRIQFKRLAFILCNNYHEQLQKNAMA